MKRVLLAGALFASCLSVVAWPTNASANGRFPESNQLFFSPNDEQQLILRTTFGFLVSRDRGLRWQWICEQAFPLSGAEDPMVAVTPSGNVLATTFQGMSRAKASPCNWEYLTTAPLANPDTNGVDRGRVFIDLTTNPNDPKNVVVFASTYDRQDEDGGIYFSSQLFETTDEGETFTKLGPDLDPSLLGYTLDLTKSDPQRIYVTAVRNPGADIAAVLLTSKDRGQTYTEAPILLEDTERSVFIAAVDPNDADRVYVRTSNATDKPSRLLFSPDAGQTWQLIYKGMGPLPGFALSPDGTKVYVGGPRDGIQVASTTDFAFKQTNRVEVQCLALGTDGLWACSNEKSGFVIALSKDDGVSFEKETHFCDIAGALDCPVGTSTNAECPGRWPVQAGLLGCATDDAGIGDGGVSDGSVPEGDAIVDPGGGCDCRSTSSSTPSGAAAAAVTLATATLAAAGLLRRSRRRDDSSD